MNKEHFTTGRIREHKNITPVRNGGEENENRREGDGIKFKRLMKKSKEG